MKIKRVIQRRLVLAAIATALMTGLWSCSDERPTLQSESSQLIVELAMPQSRSSINGSDATSTPAADECRINNLRFIAFPQNGKGSLINQPLIIPDGAAATTEFRVNGITVGDYRVYLVANMGSEVDNVSTEQQLRQIMLNYGTASSPKLPQPGNLPMIYEPQGVTSVTDKSTRVNASLQIACVKVSLNVIFDKAHISDAAAAFGDKGLRVKSLTAYNVSTATTLVSTGNVNAAAYSTPLSAGTHYKNWTRDNGNVTVDDADVIGNLSGAVTPIDPSQAWCYHKVIYLPERFVNSDDQQTYLTLDGEIYGAGGSTGTANASNTYRIDLGHAISGKRQLPRDTYYEVIATVKSFGTLSLNTFVSTKTWSNVALSADMRRTTLSVDKTRSTVTSLQPDTITYSSSASTVTFNCPASLQGYPLIIATNDTQTKKITLKVNPNISIETLAADQLKGEVSVSLKANNLTKYIDVAYDIQPFFTVSDTEHMIFWGDAVTKKARVTTNLGGIRYPWSLSHHLKKGSYYDVIISQESLGNGEWNVVMTLNADPVTTTDESFVIGPNSDKYYSSLRQTMTVTAKPRQGKYRIYMRAINDRQNADGSFQGILAEGSNNVNDGWNNDHRVYFYYQYGESGGTGEIPRSNVWIFSEKHWDGSDEAHFYGDGMSPDSQNPGWYYKDYAENHMGKHIDNAKADRSIIPGETLVIFHNNEDIKKGYMRHRFTHHMDPGITLFDFEDREGWYLYDPTCDPYYRIYDEKPVIEDIIYTIYYKGTVNGWYNQYGVADSDDVTKRYTIYSNSIDSRVSAGNGWYKHTIKLKAPRGEYEKALNVKFSGTSKEPMLFDGNSWTVGYYDGSWHKGAPSGVTL